MKKSILSLVIISLFGLMSYAQGNLQFNRVFFVDNNTVTVPTGKVWKISYIPEKVSVTYVKYMGDGGGNTWGCTGNRYRIYNTVTEEFPFSQGAFIINNSFSIIPASNGVFWLPEGTTISCPIYKTPLAEVGTNTLYRIDGSGNICGPHTFPQVDYNALLSVIEFNIIP